MDGYDVVGAFEKVISALNALCLHVHDELHGFPVWVDKGDLSLVPDRDKVIYVLKHLSPMEGLSPQETFACVGAVGGNSVTLALVAAVNQAKDDFREVVNRFLSGDENRETAIIRRLLALNGYPGIRLKQVFRHIRSVEYHPRRISFVKGRHNSHRIITAKQAEQKLNAVGQGMHIDIQLAKLSLLEPHARLVIHRDVQSHWLANVSTFKNDSGRSKTVKVPTSLPLFYLHESRQPTPVVTFARKYERIKAQSRADKQIEENVFLPSIQAFRYKTTRTDKA